MNATALTEMARDWEPVPEQHLCTYTADVSHLNPLSLHSARAHTLTLSVSGCVQSEYPVKYLEHVQVGLKVSLSRRGALKAVLVSPGGTRVLLLPGRTSDSRHRVADFTVWPILSVQTWGEDPRGNWTLLLDVTDQASGDNTATLFHWSLRLFGTETPAQSTDPLHEERSSAPSGGAGTSSAPNRPEALAKASTNRRFRFPSRRPFSSSTQTLPSLLSMLLPLLTFPVIQL